MHAANSSARLHEHRTALAPERDYCASRLYSCRNPKTDGRRNGTPPIARRIGADGGRRCLADRACAQAPSNRPQHPLPGCGPDRLVLIANLDPASTYLAEHYDTIVEEMMAMDLEAITVAKFMREVEVATTTAYNAPDHWSQHWGGNLYADPALLSRRRSPILDFHVCWCPRRDSNPHASRLPILSRTRLPFHHAGTRRLSCRVRRIRQQSAGRWHHRGSAPVFSHLRYARARHSARGVVKGRRPSLPASPDSHDPSPLRKDPRTRGEALAPYALGAVAFAESSFFPVPPDVMMGADGG